MRTDLCSLNFANTKSTNKTILHIYINKHPKLPLHLSSWKSRKADRVWRANSVILYFSLYGSVKEIEVERQKVRMGALRSLL